MRREDGWLRFTSEFFVPGGDKEKTRNIVLGPPPHLSGPHYSGPIGPRVILLIEETPGELDDILVQTEPMFPDHWRRPPEVEMPADGSPCPSPASACFPGPTILFRRFPDSDWTSLPSALPAEPDPEPDAPAGPSWRDRPPLL